MQDDRKRTENAPRSTSPLALRNLARAVGGVAAVVAVAAAIARLASASQSANGVHPHATEAAAAKPSAEVASSAHEMPSATPSAEPAPSATSVGTIGEHTAARAELGKKIFSDATLSDPPGTSCATCHDPARGFAGNNGSTLGVAQGSRPGHFARRNTPSVLYLKFVPRFGWHWEEDVDLPDGIGGFFWDGRSDSLAKLVEQPLFNPDEMNGGDAARVAAKLKDAPYAAALRAEFGEALDDATGALGAMGTAIEAFLRSDQMAPFTSKYDDVIRGRAAFTDEEALGLKLFKDRAKGGCDACHHVNEASSKPERSLFTDYGYEAVGAPRNARLPPNRDANSFDLGLCERHEHTHMNDDRLCGAFRTPSLRNVATRASFMHNGKFTKLRDVVAFYATRGTDPKRWYRSGKVYDDLPETYRANVRSDRAPYDRGPGQTPRMNDAEIDAIVAFLQTLTDAEYR
jgi:cytochrome c peroxidase